MKDPFHTKCTLVHFAAAMELGHSNNLFLLACNLIKDHPQDKVTSVDTTIPQAWIGSGNAYAVQEETDQAMIAQGQYALRMFWSLINLESLLITWSLKPMLCSVDLTG